MNAPSRPILRWHGGKWRLAPWIIGHFPPHKVYVEPFGGAASVLLRKPRATSEIWNDRDGELVNLFRVLREQAAELAQLVALTPFARDEYDGLYQPAADPLERARRFVARSFMGLSSKGALRKSGFDTRCNPDGFVARVRSLVAVPEEIAAVAGRFLSVVIENEDALSLIARYGRADALLYVDPPYLDSVGGVYRHGVDHEALLSALVDIESMVVLSGYPSELYDDTLSGWTRLETTSFADGAHERCEVIWLNPACADALGAARHRRAGGQGTPLFEVAR